MPDKAHIITFGCQMNEHDSHRMMAVLEREGYAFTKDAAEASLIIVNTCSVRRNPENKVFSALGMLRPLKRKNPRLLIAVAGCVAQQHGPTIMEREKAVDMVFGPDNYFRLPEMLERVKAGERVVMTDWLPRNGRVQNFVPDAWVESGRVEGCKAYIAIMKGCDNFCSFCIVPKVRGREVSREPDNILREAKALIQNGAREIWLLGQNVNSYRAGGTGFLELLDQVAHLDGLKRLRFTSPHPKDLDNNLSDLMSARPVICNHLHLPLQAGADCILERMRRKHTVASYLEKVRYLRSVIPNVEISTDVIVGFPSETEEDFKATLSVLEEVRFSQVYSFKYSPRPGTKAAEMDDDVPKAVKEDRLQRLIALQERINVEQLERYISTTQTVLIEGVHVKDPAILNGRTDGYRPVSVKDPALNIGAMPAVRITGKRGHWLTGETSAPTKTAS